MKDKDVHTEHCCRVHGCKYGDKDCTVYLGYLCQSFPCEVCDWEFGKSQPFKGGPDFSVATLKDIPKVKWITFLKRRQGIDDE